MSDHELVDYLILREIDPPVTHAKRERASERSIAALETVRDDGEDIEWVESQIMTNEEDMVTGTLCHFRAESEEALYEHADCAGLPVSRVFHQGEPVDGPDR
ncbi:MAG: nickel-binding protein [Natronomonas sp.]